MTNDHLGSPRITTDANGGVTSRRDFMPFGEEVSRASYGTDTVRQKFTTYKRDDETGLDFAEARYYSSRWGRFVSPDEFTGGPDELFDFADDASDNPTFYADLENPQSLNKYQYTYNNPLNLTDSDGHCPLCLLGATETAMPNPILEGLKITTEAVTKIAIEASEVFPLPKHVGSLDFLTPNYKPFDATRNQVFRRPATDIQSKPLESRSQNLKPVPKANGPHSTARRDSNGKVTRYTTWEKNPKNPTGNFTPRKSVDTKPGGRPHTDRNTGRRIPTPHTQSDAKNSRGKPRIPGGVRPARQYELPQ